MTLIIILSIIAICYAFYEGYKQGEEKGWNEGTNDTNNIIREYIEIQSNGGSVVEKTKVDNQVCSDKKQT